MQHKENSSWFSSSSLRDVHLEWRLNLSKQSTQSTNGARQQSKESISKVKRIKEQSWPPYLVPFPCFIKVHWSDIFPWRRLCEQSVENKINLYFHSNKLLTRVQECGCDLMRRSRQSSWNCPILSDGKCRVPLGPSHARWLIATRKAFIWRHPCDKAVRELTKGQHLRFL